MSYLSHFIHTLVCELRDLNPHSTVQPDVEYPALESLTSQYLLTYHTIASESSFRSGLGSYSLSPIRQPNISDSKSKQFTSALTCCSAKFAYSYYLFLSFINMPAHIEYYLPMCSMYINIFIFNSFL